MKVGLFISAMSLSLLALTAKAADQVMISDIDDTIKLSHIPSKAGSFNRMFDEQSRFLGMAELYQTLALDNPGLQVYYVSKAPKFLMQERHIQFLVNGSFPRGFYVGYQGKTLPSNHKVESIKAIIKAENPKRILLIGDNGEQDSEVYEKIQKEFPQIKMTILIRQLYATKAKDSDQQGNKIAANQNPFITTADATMIAVKNGFLKNKSAEELVQFLTPLIVDEAPFQKEGILSFPEFIDCSEYQWKISNQNLNLEKELSQIQAKVEETCKLSHK